MALEFEVHRLFQHTLGRQQQLLQVLLPVQCPHLCRKPVAGQDSLLLANGIEDVIPPRVEEETRLSSRPVTGFLGSIAVAVNHDRFALLRRMLLPFLFRRLLTCRLSLFALSDALRITPILAFAGLLPAGIPILLSNQRGSSTGRCASRRSRCGPLRRCRTIVFGPAVSCAGYLGFLPDWRPLFRSRGIGNCNLDILHCGIICCSFFCFRSFFRLSVIVRRFDCRSASSARGTSRAGLLFFPAKEKTKN